MSDQNEPIEQLKEIRSLMERSSRFISLSGLSGVCAGIFALIGAYFAYIKTGSEIDSSYFFNSVASSWSAEQEMDLITYLILDAIIVLVCSIVGGLFFTLRKAKRKGQTIWDPISIKFLMHLFIPLLAGGIFCLILIYHNIIGLVAPATLLFYGLALLNASKYTLHDIGYLGICEILLGLIASVYIGYGITFWAIGFGVLHIIYGTVMYFKYER